MADIITVKKGGEFELPACEFAPESGSEFVGWKIGDELYQEGNVVTLSKDTVLMAVWKVKAPEDDPANDPSDPANDPSGDPEEIAIPDPVKPVSVEFVVYKRKPDPKTADDPSDIPADVGRSGRSSADAGRSGRSSADAGRSGRSSADAGRSGRSSADIGRSGGSNARVYAGNGEFRSPDSGDGAEPLLWIMIMAVMGMAVCVVRHVSVSRG